MSTSDMWIENRGLPLFLTRENQYKVGLVMFLSAAASYLLVNHWPMLTPQQLPMTWVDRHVPFMPNTVWIYMSESLLFASAYILSRDMVNLNKYVYSFTALNLLSVMIFWVWPTTYPRYQFPLPDDLNALTYYFFNWVRHTDAPSNCCPSLHVSSVYLSSYLFLDEQPRKFPFYFVWATAVAVSTLTTKQHYLVDLVTGFMLSVLMFWFFHRFMTYRPATGVAEVQAKR